MYCKEERHYEACCQRFCGTLFGSVHYILNKGFEDFTLEEIEFDWLDDFDAIVVTALLQTRILAQFS